MENLSANSVGTIIFCLGLGCALAVALFALFSYVSDKIQTRKLDKFFKNWKG